MGKLCKLALVAALAFCCLLGATEIPGTAASAPEHFWIELQGVHSLFEDQWWKMSVFRLEHWRRAVQSCCPVDAIQQYWRRNGQRRRRCDRSHNVYKYFHAPDERDVHDYMD